jgi:hypothetical protein
MAVRQILPEQTLETLRTEFNALAKDDFGDIATLDATMSATNVIGAVNELAGQIFSAAGWKMEDSTSTTQTVGPGQTGRFLGTSNQINAVVSVPDTLTMSLTDDVTITTSISSPTVNAGNLTLSSGYITDSSGTISFDNENITTNNEVSVGTGTFGTVAGTGSNHTLGTIQISGNNISSTDSTEINIADGLQVSGPLKAGSTTINPAGSNNIESSTGFTVFGSKPYIKSNQILFSGITTGNSINTTFEITDPTSNRTMTFPDATGTVVLTDSGVATGSIFTASVSLVIYNSAGVAQKTIVGSAT